ncbi:MAG: hypothetical protein ACE5FU_05260 [Nitrospinota bacterium]
MQNTVAQDKKQRKSLSLKDAFTLLNNVLEITRQLLQKSINKESSRIDRKFVMKRANWILAKFFIAACRKKKNAYAKT